MKNLNVIANPEVVTVFDKYPPAVRKKILRLRKLIFDAAMASPEVTVFEETLKWGEPSYLTKNGSTIRIDWKSKAPDQYAMYFKCTSKLVPAFKRHFSDVFQFEGDRAIVFQMHAQIPDAELKKCITAGLTYHKVKHLPDLGLE